VDKDGELIDIKFMTGTRGKKYEISCELNSSIYQFSAGEFYMYTIKQIENY